MSGKGMKKRIIGFLLFLTVAFFVSIFSSTEVSAENPFDPYHRVRILIEYLKGRTTLSGGLTGDDLSMSKYGALQIRCSQGRLNSARIKINTVYSFDRNPVGRIAIVGISEKNVTAYVDVYLDDETEPAASFLLKGAKETALEPKNKSVDVYDRRLTGEHSVSLGFRVSGKSDNDEVSLILSTLEFAESSLPVVYFDIDESKGTVDAMNESREHDVKCFGKVSIRVPDGYISEYSRKEESGYEDLELEYIKGRGNSSWNMDKKPYKFKLDKKADFFGMGANKHWVLISNRQDNSQMRNRVTYHLGQKLGMEYTPQSIPVEVVMNGEYLGTYFLSEQVRVGEGRVEVEELTADDTDITGGYLISRKPDETDAEENKLITDLRASFLIEYPDITEGGNDAEKQYIMDYLQKTEDAIFGNDFRDTEGKSYKEYLDFDSLVDYWWVQELAINTDAYDTTSTYLYKKRGGKLYFGPLWDFDAVAWGSAEYYGDRVEGFNNTFFIWINRLKEDPEFLQAIHDRWPAIDAELEEVIKPGGLLDKYYEEMKVAESYNVELWSYDSSPLKSTCTTYRQEVEEYRNWIIARRAWINENIENIYKLTYKLTFMVDDDVHYEIKGLIGKEPPHLPIKPEKPGYIFSRWVGENGEGFDQFMKPEGDIIYHAEFVEIKKDRPLIRPFTIIIAGIAVLAVVVFVMVLYSRIRKKKS